MNENKKKLFLSTSSGFDWNTIKRWNMSAKNTGHDVCNLLINTNKELVDTCHNNGVNVVGYNVQSNKLPHDMRFLLQYKYLMSVKDQYSHVIITDSRDVYFSNDPFPKLLSIMKKTKKDIVCGSESICYKDESWGDGNLREGFNYIHEEFRNNEICNVGVLCGTTEAIADLCLLIFTMCYHNPAGVSDQSSFNVIMGTKFGKETVAITRPSDGLMVHLGTVGVHKFRDNLIEKPTWDETLIPEINGVTIPIVHQYDRINTSKWNLP
jgi:hypothetical protein